MIPILPAALIALACPVPAAPLPAGRAPENMAYADVERPDGSSRMVWGWWSAGKFYWRDVDQSPHPIHAGTPIDTVFCRYCFPTDCRPEPPGCMPTERSPLRSYPAHLPRFQ